MLQVQPWAAPRTSASIPKSIRRVAGGFTAAERSRLPGAVRWLSVVDLPWRQRLGFCSWISSNEAPTKGYCEFPTHRAEAMTPFSGMSWAEFAFVTLFVAVAFTGMVLLVNFSLRLRGLPELEASWSAFARSRGYVYHSPSKGIIGWSGARACLHAPHATHQGWALIRWRGPSLSRLASFRAPVAPPVNFLTLLRLVTRSDLPQKQLNPSLFWA